MSSDYLKQLQLTKQLEQKAKELTRERRQAEARLSDVRKALDAAKGAGIDVTEPEATLTQASEAFTQRDNAKVLALADNCVGQLQELKRERLSSIVDGSQKMVNSFGGSIELKERFEKILAIDDTDEALSMLAAAEGDAHRFAAERFEQRAVRADSLLRYAAALEMPMNVASEDIDAARRRLSEGEREAAWADISACMERLMAPFELRFNERRRDIDDLVARAASAGVEVSALTELLNEGEEALRHEYAGQALELLRRAEKERSVALSSAIAVRIEELRGEAIKIKGHGAPLAIFEGELRNSERADGEEALASLRLAAEALQEARASALMNAIETLRPRLTLARRLDIDPTPAMMILDDARRMLADRDLESALRKVAEAGEAIDAGLSGHLALADELRRTRELFLTMRELRLPPGEASSMVSESRQRALAGEVEEARALLAETSERLREALLDAGSRRALSGLANLSEAIAIGAEVDEEKERLLQALEGFRQGDLNGAVSELGDIAALLRNASADAAAERVDGTSKRVSSSIAADLSDLVPGVEDARRLLGNGDILGAAGLAIRIEAEAIARQRDASATLSIRAAELLTLSRMLNCASATIEQKMERAERSPDPAESATMFIDIIHYATQFIKDELTASLARLTRDIATARRNGVHVDKVGKLSEDVARKLLSGDVDGCHEAIEEAREMLERSASLHTDLYDRIASLSRAISEAGLPPKNAAQTRLEVTKQLFEAGKYDGARVSANACLDELERLAAASLIPARMEEGREIVALLGSLSLDMTALDALMQNAEEDTKRGRHDRALSSLKEVERAASEAVRKGLKDSIAQTSAMLRNCSDLGCDAHSAMDVLDRASSLLNESRYQDALRAVRFADSEGQRLLALYHSVQTSIEEAYMWLEEADEHDVDVPEASVLLERARDELRTGKQSLALERGRMVQTMVRRAVASHLEQRLDDMERGSADLAGDDLREYAIDRDTIIKALERGPRWAYREAARYERALAEVEALRGRALAALDSIASDRSARSIKRARGAFERGEFSKCISLLAIAGAMEPLVRSQDERRKAALAELRKDVSEVPDVKSASLLDEMENATTPQRFWELYNEVLDALDIRRQEQRQEQVGRLIDALRAMNILRPDGMPEHATRLLSRPLSLLSVEDLDSVPEMEREAEKIVTSAVEQARSDGPSDAALTAAKEAEVLLANGSLALAARAALEANLARGWTSKERTAMWGEHDELIRRVLVLEKRGGELGAVRDLLRTATASPPDRSREAMAEAWSRLVDEERALFPSIRMDVLDRIEDSNGWKRLSIALSNDGGTAAGLRAEAEGGELRAVLPSALPPGRIRSEMEVKGDPTVTLLYRPLFSKEEESSPNMLN